MCHVHSRRTPRQAGLLTPRTVQAHCTYLTPEELSRLAQHGTAIAHCPLSNAYFSGLQLVLREALDRGVRVGLGTDIAGGYSIDIMGVMRLAVGISRISEGARLERSGSQATASEDQVVKAESNSKSISVNWKEALYLGTRGGALALGLGGGVFKIGVPFDAQQSRHCFSSLTLRGPYSDPCLDSVCLLNPDSAPAGIGPLDFFDTNPQSFELSPEMVEKWWCVGDTRNRTGMWIQGRRVFFG